ncbi:MAG: pseudouridine-5'-phosphate glycosidase, partial [Chloroflexota bacterium]|nr:pseudouridine-5'-phosphate glycosidase [Chloroflexota bacterium]
MPMAAALAGRLTLATEVETALREKRPVVALESTLISHGLPYPA